ncbi:MAG: hypothetical protein AAF518_16355 [Spirochaetota bacterium]
MKSFLLFVLLGVLPFTFLHADEYHNINGFFGERASAFAGAFTAVADDPSGGYYNPAGLSFATANSISISASTYNKFEKTFVDALGPGQNLALKSETYMPNFIGALREITENTNLGMSLISPVTQAINQSNQVVLPLTLPEVAEAKAESTQQKSILVGGPSLSYALKDNVSIGASLLFFSDYSLSSNNFTISLLNKTNVVNSERDERRTRGFLPILGIMYMPTEKVSLGASFRKTFVTSGVRRLSESLIQSGNNDLVFNSLRTHNGSAANSSLGVFLGPPVTAEIPEVYEARGGLAWFANTKLQFSFDIIYTSSYRKYQRNLEVAPLERAALVNPPEIESLSREATSNFAGGLEFFITPNLAIKFGYFTNYANNKNISWVESALATSARGNLASGIVPLYGESFSEQGFIGYRIPQLQERERTEHVDLFGYTLGISSSFHDSSLSIILIWEKGQGGGSGNSDVGSSKIIYDSLNLYMAASTMH